MRRAALGEETALRAKRRSSWLARQDWIFAVALAAFVGVCVWFAGAIQDFLIPPSNTIPAPALIGQTLSDALATASSVHLNAAVVQRAASDRYPRDVVMRQEPAAGTQVRPQRQMSLVVSNGVQIFPMPDLRYESRRELGLDLAQYKLVLGKVTIVRSDEVPTPEVVGQDPPPLTSVRSGDVVNVDVAKGGPATVRVPRFIGMDVSAARNLAAQDRVRFGQLVWTPFGRFGFPRGTVVDQKPAPGEEIGPFQTVSLQISAGPLESGYLVRQVHALVTVPQDAAENGKTPTVRVSVTDETGTWNLYDAYASPKQRLDFNLTAIGTSRLDVFVNGGLIDSTKLGSEPPVEESQKLGPPPKGAHPPKNVPPSDLMSPSSGQTAAPSRSSVP